MSPNNPTIGRLELWTADSGDLRWKFEGEFSPTYSGHWLSMAIDNAAKSGRRATWICQAGEDHQRPWAKDIPEYSERNYL